MAPFSFCLRTVEPLFTSPNYPEVLFLQSWTKIVWFVWSSFPTTIERWPHFLRKKLRSGRLFATARSRLPELSKLPGRAMARKTSPGSYTSSRRRGAKTVWCVGNLRHETHENRNARNYFGHQLFMVSEFCLELPAVGMIDVCVQCPFQAISSSGPKSRSWRPA